MNIVTVPGANKKFNILSPIGGFGNHLRWLMLLDPEFQFLLKGTEESYNDQQGPDWPSYHDYKLSNWGNTLPEIKKEITGIFGEHDCVDVGAKLKFIQELIYPSTRSWHNWLIFEWRYRRYLNSLVDFSHSYVNLIDRRLPTVVLTIDPKLAYTAYLKFNSNLNNHSREDFMTTQVDDVSKENVANCYNTACVIDAGKLFQATLDQDFYFQLIECLGLSDQYDSANIVHGLWYQAHKRSEHEFVKDIMAIYK